MGKVLPRNLSPFGEDKEEGNRGRLVFAISSAYALVSADDFGFIIGSDVGGEKEGDRKAQRNEAKKAKEGRG